MKIITICGSYRFTREIWREFQRLTDLGYIVILPAIGCKGNDKPFYVDMHRAKIDLADIVYIIDVGGYIGEDTANEVTYAKNKGKDVRYFSERFLHPL